MFLDYVYADFSYSWVTVVHNAHESQDFTLVFFHYYYVHFVWSTSNTGGETSPQHYASSTMLDIWTLWPSNSVFDHIYVYFFPIFSSWITCAIFSELRVIQYILGLQFLIIKVVTGCYISIVVLYLLILVFPQSISTLDPSDKKFSNSDTICCTEQKLPLIICPSTIVIFWLYFCHRKQQSPSWLDGS